jgi:hypothetical protein
MVEKSNSLVGAIISTPNELENDEGTVVIVEL